MVELFYGTNRVDKDVKAEHKPDKGVVDGDKVKKKPKKKVNKVKEVEKEEVGD